MVWNYWTDRKVRPIREGLSEVRGASTVFLIRRSVLEVEEGSSQSFECVRHAEAP